MTLIIKIEEMTDKTGKTIFGWFGSQLHDSKKLQKIRL